MLPTVKRPNWSFATGVNLISYPGHRRGYITENVSCNFLSKIFRAVCTCMHSLSDRSKKNQRILLRYQCASAVTDFIFSLQSNPLDLQQISYVDQLKLILNLSILQDDKQSRWYLVLNSKQKDSSQMPGDNLSNAVTTVLPFCRL